MEGEEPYEEVEAMEEGELHIKEEPDVVMEPIKEEYLSNPLLAEPKVQVESDFEMWEPKMRERIGEVMICMDMGLSLVGGG